MKTRTPKSILTIAILIASLGAVQPAELDPAIKLADARVKYEAAVEGIRVQVDGYLAGLEDAARDLPASDRTKVGKVRGLKAQRDAFKQNGTLVDAADQTLKKLSRAYKDAKNDLIDTYTVAIDSYRGSKFKRDDLADTLQLELDALSAEEDLNAWSDNRIAAVPAAERTLTPDGKRWQTEIEPSTDAYRLEITGKAQGPGKLLIEVPVGGKYALATAKFDAAGKFTVLLSVRPDGISPDLGVERPVVAAGAKMTEDKSIALHSNGAAVDVQSVKIKPILTKAVTTSPPADSRGPGAAQVPSAKGDETRADPNNKDATPIKTADLFPLRSEWRGTYQQVGDPVRSIKATVMSVDGDTIEMEVKISGFATRIYTLIVSGSKVTQVSDDGVGQIPGTNLPANIVYNVNKSGTIKNKELTLQGTNDWKSASGNPGGSVRSSLKMTRR